MRRWLLLLLIAAPVLLHGQTPVETPLAFEVASIKPNPNVDAPLKFQLQPGSRVTIANFPLFQLIRAAYASDDIQLDDQVVSPAWTKSERFDIVAKADGSIAPDNDGQPRRLVAMMRSLVEERFRVRAHTERREMAVYLLVLANKDRKLGPRFHQSSQECDGQRSQELGGVIARGPKSPDPTQWCGMRGSGGSGTGLSRVLMQGLTMAQMAADFADFSVVRRPVLDRTGLSGRWDAQIDFIPGFLPGPNPNSAPVANPAADSGPNMPTAIQEQLGLKLEPSKASVQVLVIDHVERPTPD
jgi:uncharacterized protein (TIGR03435 family)